jgi:hypothetical protein
MLFECSNQENKMGRACAIYGEDRNAFKVIIWKPGGKRPLGTLRKILKCLLKEYGDRTLTGLKWLRTGQVVDSKNVENFLSC